MIVAVLVVGGFIYVWDEFFKYRFIAKRWGEVVPGKVYRSGQISKWMIGPSIINHNLHSIVDLQGNDLNDEHLQAEMAVAAEHGVNHVRFPLGGDGTGDIANYAAAIKVIHDCEQAGQPVLVHCAAGTQRTGGVVASYRMLVRNESPQAAYAELKRYGWKAKKSQILLDYVNGNMAELCQLLVENGVLEQAPAELPVLGP